MTYVVHNFMEAAEVAPAWRLMQDDRVASDPAVLATQERLSACTYAMAHPETGELVPACVQHSVLDPGENEQLRWLLPLTCRLTESARLQLQLCRRRRPGATVATCQLPPPYLRSRPCIQRRQHHPRGGSSDVPVE